MRTRGITRALLVALSAALTAGVVGPGAAQAASGSGAYYLGNTWYGEEEPYYCGPAAVRIALSHILSNPPSQSTIADDVDVWHNPLNPGMPSAESAVGALNKYDSTNFYSYTAKANTSPAQLVADAVYSIDHGYPMVVNLKIDPSSPHPPNYPQRTSSIYHFVTVVGYKDFGNTLTIVDPAAGGGSGGALGGLGWDNVPRQWDGSVGEISALLYTGYASGKAPAVTVPGVFVNGWPNVVRGQNGAIVQAAQYLLRYRGSGISADADFGPATQSAASSFQSSHGLHVDGEIGPQTWSALIASVSRGSNNEAVKALQTLLNRHGYSLSVDGDFGGGTDAALREYQTTHNIVSDGVAGYSTWQSIVGTRVVSLYAHANSRYVTAESAGSAPLIANRTAVGPWERFDVLPLSNGDIGLLAHANHRIVTAENAGGSALIANRTAVGLWEWFHVSPNADGTISLVSAVNGEYVTAENGGSSSLIANRYIVGLWQEFDMG